MELVLTPEILWDGKGLCCSLEAAEIPVQHSWKGQGQNKAPRDCWLCWCEVKHSSFLPANPQHCLETGREGCEQEDKAAVFVSES